jgi:hypothetical protein
MTPKRLTWFLAFALCGFTADSALGGLYRCERADGSVVYTDSQATCPGASEHRTTGAVQSTGSSSHAPAAMRSTGTRRMRRTTPSDTSAAEAAWRSKKEQTRHELSVVTSRHDALAQYVSHCNRGGELFRTLDNGLKEGVSCKGLRAEVTALAARRDELQEYLDRGLREACRKAGCLPGWIR